MTTTARKAAEDLKVGDVIEHPDYAYGRRDEAHRFVTVTALRTETPKDDDMWGGMFGDYTIVTCDDGSELDVVGEYVVRA